jgi:hypothetical protein
MKPIEQDAVEAGHALHLSHDHIGELGQRGDVLNSHQGRPERVVERHRRRRRWIRLELQDRRAVVPVDDSVEGRAVRLDAQRVRLVPALVAQRFPHRLDGGGIHDGGEGPTQDVSDVQRKVLAHVVADLRDSQRRLSENEQHPVGLDRPRDVDRFAVTVGQVGHGPPPEKLLAGSPIR